MRLILSVEFEPLQGSQTSLFLEVRVRVIKTDVQVCLIFSLTENISLKDIILLLGNQRRCVLTPNIIVLRYQKSNFHALNLLHKYTDRKVKI